MKIDYMNTLLMTTYIIDENRLHNSLENIRNK